MSPLKLAVVNSFSSFINSIVSATRSIPALARVELLEALELELASGFDLSVRLQSDNAAKRIVNAKIDFIVISFPLENALSNRFVC